jgi:hypothetical protein
MNVDSSILRNDILLVLNANRSRFGLGVQTLLTTVRYQFQVTVTKDEMLDHVDYLCRTDKPLAEEVQRQFNKQDRAWRITETGIAWLDEQHLI